MKKIHLFLLHCIILVLAICFIVGFNVLTLTKKEFNNIYWLILIFEFIAIFSLFYFIVFSYAKKGIMLYDKQNGGRITIKKYVMISLLVGFIINLGLWLPRYIKYLPYNEYGYVSIIIFALIFLITFSIIYLLIFIPLCIAYKKVNKEESNEKSNYHNS